MIEFLRDSIWTFIGVLLAILAVLVTLWIYWKQRQIKELAFGLISSRRLIAISDEISARVTVQLDGKDIEHVRLLVFGIKNSGHRAITAEDFERPISLAFPAAAVVSAQVTSQYPHNLRVDLRAYSSRVEIAPLLLNAGDEAQIQLLISGEKPNWEVDVRVRDIASPVPITTSPRLPKFMDSGLPLLIAVGLGIGLAQLIFGKDRDLVYSGLGIAAFTVIFGFLSRIWQASGKSARRRLVSGSK